MALWTEVTTSEVSDAKNEKTNRKSFARALLACAKNWRRDASKVGWRYSDEITPKL